VSGKARRDPASHHRLKDVFAGFRAERVAKLEAVCIDMFGAYIKAVIEAAPKAKLVVDGSMGNG